MTESNSRNSRPARTVRRKPGRRLRPRTKLILALILIALVLYLPLKKAFIRQIVDYGVTTQGMIAEQMAVSAAVIRQERVIRAPGAGQFTPAVKEGEKVAAGQKIGILTTADTAVDGSPIKIEIKSPEPGLICFHPDGWEGNVQPDLLDHFDQVKLDNLLVTAEPEAPAAVTSGQAVGKIIDNLVKPCLYFQLPTDFLKTLPKIGEYLSLEISGGDIRKVKIIAVKKVELQLQLVVEVVNPSDRELQQRVVPVRVIPATYHGIILNLSSIVEQEGQPGVMMLDGGMARWKKVEIVGTVGEQVAVEGVAAGDLFIQNPSWIRDGQQIE